MSFSQEFFTLSNGNKIPGVGVIGTGTAWYKQEETEATFSKALVEQVKFALTLPGIVHIDAAECYRTYPELGQALKESKKPRKEIFLTDKYSPQLKISENPIKGLNIALNKLGVDYVDLYLLHSPLITEKDHGFTLEDAWRQMEEIYRSGKAKNIGVSNFRIEDLERILKAGKIKPQVNQIEFNAFLQNQTPGIVNFCQEHDILVEAYSPLAPLQRKPENSASQPFYQYIAELSTKYGKTEAQILLRWVNDRQILPITTSSKPQRIEEAQNLFAFDLTKDEVEKITRLGLHHEPLRLYWNEQYDKYNAESQKA